MAGLRDVFQRWIHPYVPYPHFMGLAPLDSLLKLLFRKPVRVPPALWPRLVVLLVFSVISTILSLPERAAIALWLKFRPREIAPEEAPVFVLGYFRSGTTWLQTLLALDPKLRTPLWLEALSPHTFVSTWAVLRVLLTPFLWLVRIRKVTPLGATLPAEDDFAMCNWTRASVIAGRAVLPEQQDFYNRFHDLDRLEPDELARWEQYMRAFAGKLLLTARGRRLLFKSPSHTARVRHLLRVFPGARFIHISRPPTTVFQSNIALVRTLQDVFRLGLVGDRDRDFGLDDRNEAVREDLPADLELLVDDGRDALRVGGVDDRAHLGAENALGDRAFEQRVEVGHRLHQLDAVGFRGKALVDLQEGHDAALFPKIPRGRHAVDLAVHGLLEQDRAHHLVAGEGGRLDDAGTHLVDEIEHLVLVRICAFRDAVELQRLRRRAARLVEGRDETVLVRGLRRHIRLRHLCFLL